MASSLRPWLFGALAACAVLAAAYLPPSEDADAILRRRSEVRSYGEMLRLPEERAQDRLARHVNRAYRDLKREELRRWAAAELRARPPARGTPPRLLNHAAIPAADRRRLEAELLQNWQTWQPARSGSPVALLLYEDSVYDRRRGTLGPAQYSVLPDYLLPEEVDGRTCVVRASSRPWKFSGTLANDWARRDFRDALGPCALYGRFGPPGPHIRRWLIARNFDVAREEFRGSLPIPNLASRPPRGLDSIMQGFFSPIAMSAAPGLPTTYRGAACLAGERTACEHAIVDTPLTIWGARENRWYAFFPTGELYERHLGGLEQWFLSDLIRNAGAERFQRFWTSSQPVDSAFAAAFGEGMGNWIHRWAVSYAGARQRGVAATALSVLASVLLSVAIVLAAVGTARWRRLEEFDPLGRRLGLTSQ